MESTLVQPLEEHQEIRSTFLFLALLTFFFFLEKNVEFFFSEYPSLLLSKLDINVKFPSISLHFLFQPILGGSVFFKFALGVQYLTSFI